MNEGQSVASRDETELFPQLPGSEWKDLAECRGENNQLFFPGYENGRGRPATPEQALGICAVCEVQPECLEYALETNQFSGVWGGMTEDDRKLYRRRWLASKRRNANR